MGPTSILSLQGDWESQADSSQVLFHTLLSTALLFPPHVDGKFLASRPRRESRMVVSQLNFVSLSLLTSSTTVRAHHYHWMGAVVCTRGRFVEGSTYWGGWQMRWQSWAGTSLSGWLKSVTLVSQVLP